MLWLWACARLFVTTTKAPTEATEPATAFPGATGTSATAATLAT